jgi:hypothetical protein
VRQLLASIKGLGPLFCNSPTLEYEPFRGRRKRSLMLRMSRCRVRPCWRHHRHIVAPVNPDFVFPCAMFPFSPNYCKERFPIQLNWPGAARTLFEGCSLGPPGRISAQFWKPWSELYHEPERKEPFLKIRGSLALFKADTLLSNVMINPAWPRQIQLRSQRFLA